MSGSPAAPWVRVAFVCALALIISFVVPDVPLWVRLGFGGLLVLNVALALLRWWTARRSGRDDTR